MGLHEYFDDYYAGHARRRRLKVALILVAIVSLCAGAAAVFLSTDGEPSISGAASGSSPAASNTPNASNESNSTDTQSSRDREVSTIVTTTVASPAPAVVEVPGSAPTASDATSVPSSPSTRADSVTSTTREEAPATTSTAPVSAQRVDTTVVATTVETSGSTTIAVASPVPYQTLPSGEPAPIVAIFDIYTITLSGAVPSEAAVARLEALALANSKTPATVVNQLTVNPAIPLHVGVRVIEMNSVRFPAGSADILPEHAKELDRVATVMQALPNVSVLVVGHADQRGAEDDNFAISDARADAVVKYLVSVGVKAERLSSRAVGESDLLAVTDDAAALALNRRTEFIFYGLLIE